MKYLIGAVAGVLAVLAGVAIWVRWSWKGAPWG
jgi:hypothetical protein